MRILHATSAKPEVVYQVVVEITETEARWLDDEVASEFDNYERTDNLLRLILDHINEQRACIDDR